MKTRISIYLIALMGFLSLTGCETTGNGQNGKIQAIVNYMAAVAPEGEDNAIDGYRISTIKNVGKWQVHFIGLYKEDGYVRADSFDIEGMFLRHQGAPFAWKFEEEN